MSDAVHKFRRFGVAAMRFSLAEHAVLEQGPSALPELRAAGRDLLAIGAKWPDFVEAFTALGADLPEGGEEGFRRFLDHVVLASATPEEIATLVSIASKGEAWN